MMPSAAGLETGASLERIDWQAAAEVYLMGHGMTESTLKALEQKLQ
jgi:hypothetical protein